MVSKITNTLTSRKFKLSVIRLGIIACTIAMAVCGTMTAAFADNAENAAPEGVGSGTNTMNTLINVVFWILRIAILAIGGGPAIVKIVQGQNDENPRDRNAGIAGLIVTGAAFAATFVVRNLI